MKVNYHTHTRRCLHADGTEEDYIHSALDAGVNILGFSDHAPFPDVDYGYRMPYWELEEYFLAVERLSKAYRSDIIIQKSLEIEYLPQYDRYYRQLLEDYRVDYLLLGEHFFRNRQGGITNITTQTIGTELYPEYAKAVKEALETGYFRMVAHPDIFAMGRFAWDKNCELATETIIQAALDAGAVLEYNANGYRRGLQDYPDGRRYMYPHPRFWEQVRGSGVRVVIGSDCHNPAQVWDEAMDRAYRELAELGIPPIERL